MLAQIQHAISEDLGFTRNLRNDPSAANRELGFAGAEQLPVFIFETKRKNPGFLAILLEEGTDGVVGLRLGPVDHRRFYKLFINMPAIAMFGEVAFGILKTLQEFRFQIFSKDLVGKLKGASGILDDLNTLR